MFFANIPHYQPGVGYSPMRSHNNIPLYEPGYGYTRQEKPIALYQPPVIDYSAGWEKPKVDYWNNNSVYDYKIKTSF